MTAYHQEEVGVPVVQKVAIPLKLRRYELIQEVRIFHIHWHHVFTTTNAAFIFVNERESRYQLTAYLVTCPAMANEFHIQGFTRPNGYRVTRQFLLPSSEFLILTGS